MNPFNRLLVALDLRENDDMLIKHASLIAKQFGTERIYFLHAVDNLEEEEQVMAKYGLTSKAEPLDEQVMEKLNSEISHQFPENCELEAGIVEGKPFDALIHWAKVKQVDTMILGRRKMGQQSGIVSRKLVRNSPCSVMFLPTSSSANYKKVLVPIDFSPFSKELIEIAAGARMQSKEMTMGTVFIDDKKTLKKFSKSNQYASGDIEAAEAADLFFRQFPKPNLRETFAVTDNPHKNIAQRIAEYAWEKNYDFVLAGSLGYSNVGEFIIGSVAEKLSEIDDDLPLLIIKPKTH